MSIATRTQTLYVAGDPGIDPVNDVPEGHDFYAALQSTEHWMASEDGALLSTGESLDDYRKRLKEGRVWQAS